MIRTPDFLAATVIFAKAAAAGASRWYGEVGFGGPYFGETGCALDTTVIPSTLYGRSSWLPLRLSAAGREGADGLADALGVGDGVDAALGVEGGTGVGDADAVVVGGVLTVVPDGWTRAHPTSINTTAAEAASLRRLRKLNDSARS